MESTVTVPNSESTMQQQIAIVIVPVTSCDTCDMLCKGNVCGIDGEYIPDESAAIVAECGKLAN